MVNAKNVYKIVKIALPLRIAFNVNHNFSLISSIYVKNVWTNAYNVSQIQPAKLVKLNSTMTHSILHVCPACYHVNNAKAKKYAQIA